MDPTPDLSSTPSLPTDGRTGAADDHADGEPQALGFGVTSRSPSLTGGDVRDVALTSDGLLVAADVDKGMRQFSGDQKLLTWQYERRAKGEGKRGIVSSVCSLPDGRIVVSIINQRRVVLLQRKSVGSSSESGWSEVCALKLLSDPYRIDAHGLSLAVVGTKAQEKRIGALGSSSKWGPGPCIELLQLPAAAGVSGAPAGEAPPQLPSSKRFKRLEYDVLAVALTGSLLVVASSAALDVTTKESGNLWSYVVDAYDWQQTTTTGDSELLPSSRRTWRCEFDEQVQDVCAMPSKGALYVALPDSRRVAAISAATGEWLVDVLSCAPSRPLRVHVQPQLPENAAGSVLAAARAVVLFADSRVSVYSVGQFA